ncbi:MAG: JAB domain-containing protein [Coprococcus sp.]
MDLAVQLLNLNPSCPGLEGIMSLDTSGFSEDTGHWTGQSCSVGRSLRTVQKNEPHSASVRDYAFETPQSIADYYMAYMCRLGHEEVHVMMLDTKQHMISECLLTKGTVNASLIAPREIFIQALKAGAVSIVLVHNHPSGDDTPSREDLAATEKVRCAGDLIGIRLLDHIIIGSGHFTSLCGSWNH